MIISSRVALLSCLCLGSIASRVEACAALSVDSVGIAEESAVIVWDEKTHTEHFTRRATFDTKAKDVGFLVPTPNTPQLAAADDAAFGRLEKMMEPKVIVQDVRDYDYTPLFLRYGRSVQTVFNTASNSLSTATGGGVEVLASQRVAGYDTTVLKASDVRALNLWLKRHGYASSAALMEWIRPYVAKKWKITAFKIARRDKNAPVASSAVRMSFKTDTPFFPYREPKKKEAHPDWYRLLRVFFFSSQRMKGNLGSAKGVTWTNAWQRTNGIARKPVRVHWAGEIDEASHAPLARQLALPVQTVKSHPWMTVFEDESTPRISREDIVFTPSEDQKRIELAPSIKSHLVKVWIPGDVLLLVLGGIVWGIVTIFQRRQPCVA